MIGNIGSFFFSLGKVNLTGRSGLCECGFFFVKNRSVRSLIWCWRNGAVVLWLVAFPFFFRVEGAVREGGRQAWRGGCERSGERI